VNVPRKWKSIAAQLGNETFKQYKSNGKLVKKLVQTYFPDKISSKIKIPADVKSSWGFTVEEAVTTLKKLEDSYEALEDKTLGKKPSLSYLAEFLGNKHSVDGEVEVVIAVLTFVGTFWFSS